MVEPRGVEPLTSCMPWAKLDCSGSEGQSRLEQANQQK